MQISLILRRKHVTRLTKGQRTPRELAHGLRSCFRNRHPCTQAHHWLERTRRERPKRWVSTSHTALTESFSLQNGFRMQMGSVEAPLFSCAARGKAKDASSSDKAKRRLVDRERERNGGGVALHTGCENSHNHSVAASHWFIYTVTLPRLSNQKEANKTSSSPIRNGQIMAF